MDLQRDVCLRVLPSNAPLHYDIDDAESSNPKGVLQERCGNRQDEYAGVEQLARYMKHDSSIYTEGSTENYYGSARHTGYRNHSGGRHYSNEETRKRKEVEKLWHRLNACPQYRKYREKQKNSNDKEQKWPENMELVFCRALVEHPPMGRRKLTTEPDTKLQGRNELIAAFIQRETGVQRGRKQVSSHIQVLKPMVKHDPFIVQYLAGNEGEGGRRHRSASSMMQRSHLSSAIHPSNFHHPQPSRLSSQFRSSFMPAAMKLEPKIEKSTSETFQPLHFEMYVADTRQNRSCHTFSSFSDSPKLEDVRLEGDRSWHWQTAFPSLAETYGNGPLPCQTMLFEATVALLPNGIPPNAELRVGFEIETPHDAARLDNLKCRTTFYQNGDFPEEYEKPVGIDRRYPRWQLSLGSEFWAPKVAAWQKVLQKADPSDRQLAEKEVQEALQSLSAVQEIYAPSDSPRQRDVLLLICWKFELGRGGRGNTTWRNVLNEPSKPQLKPEAAISQLFADQSGAEYQQAVSSTANLFEHGAFDIGDLANVALPGLPADLEQTTVGEEMYSANGIDFGSGNIQICLDSAVPIEAYADATQAFDQYQQDQRAADWATSYPNIFDQAYSHVGFEPPIEQGREDATLGAQDFSMSPMAHIRAGRGVLSGI
ncbi:TEA-domain-containing protein [Rhizodiscina lignyota]|uniref:TEA-domain-containing protein n=1 Tax=Rhizodiscina lignyota TaxID=1504668 RepID=A0A9P4M0Y8_9PEZI|nr:TEA-domain-containing protein [Rhizodiscina lignyota]